MDIKPISHQSTNDAVFALVSATLKETTRVLDLGAGEGYFSKKLGDYISTEFGDSPKGRLAACDVTPSIFRYREIHCDPVGEDGRLPYPDGCFDIVCCLEVVEHVQDQFKLCREIVRILKPGGVAFMSTPNVLNMNSRYRALHSGFATLFDPLPLSSADVVHTSGHIHPVSYYYLAYAFLTAKASRVSVSYDRTKRSAVALLVMFLPLVLLGNALLRVRLKAKKPEVAAENAELLSSMNTWDMLTSRSIIVRALK